MLLVATIKQRIYQGREEKKTMQFLFISYPLNSILFAI